MNERETEASAAGLRDLSLLKLFDDKTPIAAVMTDLVSRFGHSPEPFDVTKLSRRHYKAVQQSYVREAGAAAAQQRQDAATARVMAESDARHARRAGRIG